MDSNKYLAMFQFEKGRIVYLLDKVKLCRKSDTVQYTDFMTPEEAMALARICSDEGLFLKLYGGLPDSERVMGGIFAFEQTEFDFPLDVLAITGNLKFESLSHRDYLGSILSVGIRREKIGDINVFEDGAEIFIHRDISSYMEMSIQKIKHTGVKTTLIPIEKARGKLQSYQEFKAIVSSMRMDCVVAEMLRISRAKAVLEIRSGGIKVNHIVREEIDYKIKENDLFSIRNHGRFQIASLVGKTKSDRQTLLIKKYI